METPRKKLQLYTAALTGSRLGVEGPHDFGALRITGYAPLAEEDPTLGDSKPDGLGTHYILGRFAVKTPYTAEPDAGMITVGGEHHIAKPLTAYLTYAQVNNEANARLRPYRDFSDDLVPIAGGQKTAVPGTTYDF